MKAKELKDKFLEFFKGREHKIIPSASLIPEHDPTVLFTTAGMHPLVPYILGQKHPLGKRLANVQKCIRTGDINEVGDETHLTFFEMLGNWSLGDYFKKEAITWSFEFLTSKKLLGFDPKILNVTVFEGDKDSIRDDESANIWQSLGIPKERIYFLPKKDNWWGPAGATGPCGPCTEMFIDTGKKKCSNDCKPGCGCGKYFEIWNDVFMEYNKTSEGKYVKLAQRNVDTGMGVERTIAMLENKKSIYDTEVFKPIIDKIKALAKIKGDNKSVRIIADHIKAATFILGDELGITPSNVDQGYVLRRLIRRAIRYGKLIGIEDNFTSEIASVIIDMYKSHYNELGKNKDFIIKELDKEEDRFKKTLEDGLREFTKILKKTKNVISGKDAFILFSSYGFPLEMTKDLAKENNLTVNEKEFDEEFKRHQELSRVGSEKRFKGGLADSSIETTRLHTATHLLNEALRKIIDKEIYQMGSNITPERLRFDFRYDKKLTPEQIKAVEDEINMVVQLDLKVTKKQMTPAEAKKIGAQAMFGEKYGEKIYVYFVGDYSKEICGGPHVEHTKQVGKFKIIKEEAISAGVRRIKAIVT